MKKKKLIAVIAAACLLVFAACYTVFIAPLLEKEQWIYKEETVERGTLKVGVTESGSLEYGITSVLYDLDLDVSDDDSDDEDSEDSDEETVQKYLKIEEVYVSAGQRIAEGDALIRFTEDSVADVRRLLESAVVDARSEYAEAQSEYNLSALEAQTEYETQKLQEQYAPTIYQNAGASVSNEITVLEIKLAQKTEKLPSLQEAIEEAQENYDEKLEAYEGAKESLEVRMGNSELYVDFQKEYISIQNQYENAKSSLTRAKQNLEDANLEIASLQRELATARAKQTIDKLEVDQGRAESDINSANAQINYNAQIESLKETLQEAEDDKNQVQEQLEAFEAFVGEDGCLYAEGTGIVTQVAYSAGDRLQNTGVMVAYATPGDMTISVDVTQEDIVDLRVGDKVDITFTAYQDISYEGTIQSINTTATSEDSNTVSYTVVISVEGDTTLLYGGMTADIIFVTEQKEDVLYISRKAIVEQDGKTYVYYKNALGGRDLKEVVTGISNGVDVEIVSGLEEGDTIYLASRVSSEEEVRSNGEAGQDTQQQNAGNGEFSLPEGMELPEGFEMPVGGEMPSGGGMPGGSGMPSGGMPGGGGMPSGGMPGGGAR